MEKTIYHLSSKDIQGKEVDFSQYKGKVLLIVNIASKCGFTPQLEELQAVYEHYKEKGLEVIGFPCNQFMFQEPLSGKGITEFCSLNYGVTFKIMEKTKVIGWSKHPVYKFLTNKSENGVLSQTPMWNFYKYLVDRNGKVVAVYPSTVTPKDTKIVKAIERCLG
jgi:glutathione peroxidase